jgi:outer membrane murein-binding lipoprotein Lpp
MRSACVFRLALPARVLGVMFGALSLIGCASDQASIEKQLAKLHDDVTRLQAETDRMSERVEAMEIGAAAARRDERVAEADAATVSRPKLKIVRVEPDSEPTAAAASEADENDGERVVIQGKGKSLESRTLPAPRTASKPAAPNK